MKKDFTIQVKLYDKSSAEPISIKSHTFHSALASALFRFMNGKHFTINLKPKVLRFLLLTVFNFVIIQCYFLLIK